MAVLWALFYALGCVVYLDLHLVNARQAHVFTPLMKRVAKDRLKPFQQLYKDSLKRAFFCVSDKVSPSAHPAG